MNATIFTTTIRHLLSQPVRLGALAGASLLPVLQTLVDPDPRLGATTWAIFTAVIATAGIIGLETSTGSLAIFFTRPLTRTSYVLSRWLAAATVAITAMSVSIGFEALVLFARGGELSPTAFLLGWADRLFVVTGIVTVMVCFSALTSSLGDLVIWIGIHIVAMSLSAAGETSSIAFFSTAGALLRRIANPMLDLHRLLSSARLPWSELTGYAATLLLALGLAIAVMNRKELTYASE